MGVVLDFIKKDDFAVWQETSVHSWNTSLTDDLDRTSIRVCWSWRRAWGRSNRSSGARSALASITAVGSGVTTETVCRTTTALWPVSADSIAIVRTTSSISCRWASGRCGRRDAENWLLRGRSRSSRLGLCAGGRRGTSVIGYTAALATVCAVRSIFPAVSSR